MRCTHPGLDHDLCGVLDHLDSVPFGVAPADGAVSEDLGVRPEGRVVYRLHCRDWVTLPLDQRLSRVEDPSVFARGWEPRTRCPGT